MKLTSMPRHLARAGSVIAAFMFVYGCINALDMPSRPRVDREAIIAGAIQCPLGSATVIRKPFTFTAPAGQIVTGVCVNDGKAISTCNANGTCSGCYVVSGIGTQTATVAELGVKKCRVLSSATFFAGAPPPPPAATVDVTVVDPHTNPVAGAQVTISYDTAPRATGVTDASGFVEFTGQPLGLRGNVLAQSSCGRNSVPFTSFVSGTNSLTVQVIPINTTLTVTVLQPDGVTPADGALVQTDVGSATTGADGKVTFAGVRVDSTKVLATHSSGGLGGGIFQLLGCTDQVTIVLPPPPPPPPQASLTVTVLQLGSETPVAGATVEVVFSGGATFSDVTDSNGQAFFLNLPTNQPLTVSATKDGSTGSEPLPGLVGGLNQVFVHVN
jgi:hypothetical protein